MSEALMLVNVVEEEETRIAILEDDKLQEFNLERASRDHIVGNIYKAKVVNIAPSIEAAFVDFGYRKHGFLHASDVRPSVGGHEGYGRGSRDISKTLRSGDEVLVQVTKEGIGEKGPALTTYLSIPGRHLVLMPGMSLRGVSRRITEQAERDRLKKTLKELDIPADVGVITRTAGSGITKVELQRDLDYLLRLWNVIKHRAEHLKTPVMVYQESDHVIRVIRDAFSEDIRKVVVDSPKVYERVREFMREVMPHHVRKVKLYEESEPLFHHYGVEGELEKMHSRRVELPSGGSIVLQQTEALVAIDVNSSQYKGERDPEKAAYKINLEAAVEIARQLRLRDLGGVIVIDFIDMRDKERRTDVEKALWNSMKRDKARTRVLKMSPFCIVELTRQRRRVSLGQAAFVECPVCHGTGLVKSPETMALDMIRRLQVGLSRADVARVDLEVTPEVANYLNNVMRARLQELENETRKQIVVHANPDMGQDEHKIAFLKEGGAVVTV